MLELLPGACVPGAGGGEGRGASSRCKASGPHLDTTPAHRASHTQIHTSSQPWVRGEHHDIQVTLARLFTQLHAAQRRAASFASTPATSTAADAASATAAAEATAGPSNRGGAAGSSAPPSLFAQQQQLLAVARDQGAYTHLVEVSRKFWVRAEDVAEFEYHVLQHLPVCGLQTMSSGGGGATSSGAPGASGGGLGSAAVAGSAPSLMNSGGGALAAAGAGGRAASVFASHASRRFEQEAEEASEDERSEGSFLLGPAPRGVPGSMTRSAASLAGVRQVVNLLYLDNASLELYHNLLYGRPYSAMVRPLASGGGSAAWRTPLLSCRARARSGPRTCEPPRRAVLCGHVAWRGARSCVCGGRATACVRATR